MAMMSHDVGCLKKVPVSMRLACDMRFSIDSNTNAKGWQGGAAKAEHRQQ